jgi:hypothetical protein
LWLPTIAKFTFSFNNIEILKMRRIITLLIFVASGYNGYCQTTDSLSLSETPTSINEVTSQLSADTIVLYYNDQWQLVRPQCAYVFRVSKIDTLLMTFSGKFIDYHMDSSIAVEGNYVNGKKEGLFKLYFENGGLNQSGYYKNNQKSGLWEYYYENGSKKQVLEFTNNEILVKDFWNEEGKKMVDAGVGDWYGYKATDKFVKVSGKVFDGRKDGKWSNSIVSQNFTTNIEKYKKGIFISGEMMSILRGTESYKDSTYCTIEQTPAFLKAEQFQVRGCNQLPKRNYESAKYPGGMEEFYNWLSINYSAHYHSSPNSLTGFMMIQITINEKGKMTNFKAITSIGLESRVIKSMEMMNSDRASWIPAKINGKPTTDTKIINFEVH